MNSDTLAGTLDEIRRGWIPASIYSDTKLFEHERQRLFGRTWQFLGHESEVPKVGDYVVRRVLDDSFILIRGDDGKMRALLNMCRHRGMQICRAETGNAKRLVCPYHMWAYRNDGRLFNVPFHQEAYGGNRGLARDNLSLIEPARTALFQGMVFISQDENAPPLDEYIGEFATYLSFYTGPSKGGIELRGPQRWRFNANWKVSSENFSGDSYHTPHTHASIAEIGVMPAARAGSRKAGAVYYAGHGAGATFKLPDGSFEERLAAIGYPKQMIRDRSENWPEAVRIMIGRDGFVPSAATLFPNLSMLHLWARTDHSGTVAPFTTFRVWQPISAGETETLSWFAVDKGATPEFKEASYKAYLMCFGSTGMFEQDDMENWSLVTRMSSGQMGRRVQLHNRMGLLEDGSSISNPLIDFPGTAVAHVGFSEHNQRRFFETWCGYLAQEGPAQTPLKGGSAERNEEVTP
jgi:phenylpropionate dioxygenase-like ring-hydroxylating dioxygenase large terminal subunit